MEVKFIKKGSTLIIKLSGELDHHYSEYARDKMDGEILKSTTRNVILDFSELTFMDSSGIGVVAGRYKNISRLNGKMLIVCDNNQVIRILEMSGIFKIVPLFSNLDEAIDELQVYNL